MTDFVAGVPRWKPLPVSPEKPADDGHRVDDGRLDAEPPDDVLGGVRIAAREGLLAQRVAVLHGDRVAHEAPAALQARAEIVLAGEQRLLGRRALEEDAVAIALQELEPEGNLEQADGRHEQRHGRAFLARELERRLGVHEPRRRAVHGVAVELERARDVLAVDGRLEPRAANHEPLFVERRQRRRVDLVLGRLSPRCAQSAWR